MNKLKDKFNIIEITKKEAKELVSKYHYLKDKDFLFMCAYGLQDIKTYNILGCVVFGRTNGISSTKGWFGIGNGAEESKGIYELTRLVVHPDLNGKNYTSYLLGNSLKKLRKEKGARAVITLADSDFHVGYIYQACNFLYYGMTDPKTDFYMEFPNDVGYKLNPIGKTKDKYGVWLPRSRKHRYAIVYDKNIKIKYEQQPYPKHNTVIKRNCCGGTNIVIDKRFNITYTCPKCTGKLIRINNNDT